MADTKHPAEVLACLLESDGWPDAAEMVRRIPALEAERDQLHAEVMEQARLLGMSGERELALRAEIDRLRKDAERYGN